MKRLLQLCIISLILAAGSESVWATDSFMQVLPSNSRFGCLICHRSTEPVSGSAELNNFGDAFRENGFKWDAELAKQRSDGDACTNGFELGDSDGDGQLDADQNEERSNPGEQDCTLQLEKSTWTALKTLFSK